MPSERISRRFVISPTEVYMRTRAQKKTLENPAKLTKLSLAARRLMLIIILG